MRSCYNHMKCDQVASLFPSLVPLFLSHPSPCPSPSLCPCQKQNIAATVDRENLPKCCKTHLRIYFDMLCVGCTVANTFSSCIQSTSESTGGSPHVVWSEFQYMYFGNPYLSMTWPEYEYPNIHPSPKNKRKWATNDSINYNLPLAPIMSLLCPFFGKHVIISPTLSVFFVVSLSLSPLRLRLWLRRRERLRDRRLLRERRRRLRERRRSARSWPRSPRSWEALGWFILPKLWAQFITSHQLVVDPPVWKIISNLIISPKLCYSLSFGVIRDFSRELQYRSCGITSITYKLFQTGWVRNNFDIKMDWKLLRVQALKQNSQVAPRSKPPRLVIPSCHPKATYVTAACQTIKKPSCWLVNLNS